MAMTPRLLAPVAAPPPPKPPQLNIVASALMPDVKTDTMGPVSPNVLASAGWRLHEPDDHGHRAWDRPPGDTFWQAKVDEWNNLVAAVGVMGDMELKQIESQAGVTVDSLPASIFPATASTRWTGGFAYAPENEYQAPIADPCGQKLDVAAITPPVLSGANSGAGSHSLTTASYDYVVTAVTSNGESAPSNTVTVAVTSGSASLTWTTPGVGYISSWNVYGRTHSATLHLLANVTVPHYIDDGTASPGATAAPSSDTTAGTGPASKANLAMVGYIPFLIQVEDHCTAFNWQVRDFTGRALRLLDNATPNAIENEFWTGAFATNTYTGPIYQSDFSPGLNTFLTQGGTASSGGSGTAATDLTPGGGPPSITRGIQILEDYIANTGFGGQGMIHVQPQTSPNLLGARRVGSLLLSVMDNIIVPGSGYGVTGPSAASPATGTAYIFATDLVSVRLDEPMIWTETFAEAVDRSTFGEPNQVRIRAQRFAAATFDMARFAACRVTLTT